MHSNDVQPRHWDNGDLNFPPAKSQGRTVMTSDFIDPIGGFVQYNDEIWDQMKVNHMVLVIFFTGIEFEQGPH